MRLTHIFSFGIRFSRDRDPAVRPHAITAHQGREGPLTVWLECSSFRLERPRQQALDRVIDRELVSEDRCDGP